MEIHRDTEIKLNPVVWYSENKYTWPIFSNKPPPEWRTLRAKKGEIYMRTKSSIWEKSYLEFTETDQFNVYSKQGGTLLYQI